MTDIKNKLIFHVTSGLEIATENYLYLTSGEDVEIYQKDIDIVLYSSYGFSVAKKVLLDFLKENKLTIIKQWEEKNKFFIVVKSEDDTFFGVDLMLGFSHAGRTIIDAETLTSMTTLSDSDKINFIKQLKKYNNNGETSYQFKKISLLGSYKRILLLGLNKIRNYTRPSGGLFIVFLGPDGSGKTTIINSVIDRIEKGRLLKTVKYHLRASLKKRKQTNKTKKKTLAQSRPQEQHQRGAFMSVVKLLYVLVVYNLVYIVRILPHIKASKVVIHDRYYYDIYTDQKRFGYSYSPKFARFIGKYIPAPDVVFVLTADADVITKRKDDLTLPQAEELVAKYRALTENNFKCKLVMIDTDDTVDNITNKVTRKILNAI